MKTIPITFVDEKARAGDAVARDLLMPKQASAGAAGFDLVSASESDIVIAPGRRALVPTGVALALPDGFEGQVRPRSGLAFKHGVTCLNSPGTIDADYRGEVKVILANFGQEDFVVSRGMRIAQLVIAPVVACALDVRFDLDETSRGSNGFGSTGV